MSHLIPDSPLDDHPLEGSHQGIVQVTVAVLGFPGHFHLPPCEQACLLVISELLYPTGVQALRGGPGFNPGPSPAGGYQAKGLVT